jgi:hypothetical protein
MTTMMMTTTTMMLTMLTFHKVVLFSNHYTTDQFIPVKTKYAYLYSYTGKPTSPKSSLLFQIFHANVTYAQLANVTVGGLASLGNPATTTKMVDFHCLLA